MRVYTVPEAVKWVEPDYRNFDFELELAREAEHAKALKSHLVEMGYRGKYTGEIVRFGVADGYARYMLADGRGRYGNSFLIHLPYGDAWHYNGIEHFPKSAIVQQIDRARRMDAMFSTQRQEK